MIHITLSGNPNKWGQLVLHCVTEDKDGRPGAPVPAAFYDNWFDASRSEKGVAGLGSGGIINNPATHYADRRTPHPHEGQWPCNSDVRAWMKVMRSGDYFIWVAYPSDNHPCHLKMSVGSKAVRPPGIVQPPVQRPPIAPPPEPPGSPLPPAIPLGDCGCSILCTELDEKNQPIAGAHSACQITIDFTDLEQLSSNMVLGMLRAEGDDPANLYPWSVECKNGWLQFNGSVHENIIKASYESAPGSSFHGSLSDPPKIKCGASIPFLMRPTKAALDLLMQGEVGTLIETVVARVGVDLCPMEIYITGDCDLVKLERKIGPKPIPKVRTDCKPIRWLNIADWHRLDEYSDLRPGFTGDRGWAIFAQVKVDVLIASEWRPFDCCCLYPAKVSADVQIDYLIDRPHKYDDGSWACAELALEFARSRTFVLQVADLIQATLKNVGYAKFPLCSKATQTDCNILKQKLHDDTRSAAEYAINSLLSPAMNCQSICVPQSMARKDGTRIVDARGALEYWPTSPMYPPEISIVWSKAVSDPFFSMDSVLNALPVFEQWPCCILVWIHGYNTPLAESEININRVKKMYQTDGEGCCKVVGYCWNGNPPDKLDFWAAIQAANLSAPGLAALVRYLQATYPNVPITLGAHSLGNLVMFRAMELLNPGDVEFLLSVAAAIPNDVFDAPRDNGAGGWFRNQLAKVRKTYIAYNRFDNVLADFFQTLLDRGIETFGPFEVSQWKEALGETGPKRLDQWLRAKVELFDMSSRWRFEPKDLPGDDLDRTTHSAVYYWHVAYSFWRNEVRGALDGNTFGCAK